MTKAVISGVKAGLSGIASMLSTVAKAGVGAGAALLAFTKFAVLGERDALTGRCAVSGFPPTRCVSVSPASRLAWLSRTTSWRRRRKR